jgi:hypothetical protein
VLVLFSKVLESELRFGKVTERVIHLELRKPLHFLPWRLAMVDTWALRDFLWPLGSVVVHLKSTIVKGSVVVGFINIVLPVVENLFRLSYLQVGHTRSFAGGRFKFACALQKFRGSFQLTFDPSCFLIKLIVQLLVRVIIIQTRFIRLPGQAVLRAR